MTNITISHTTVRDIEPVANTANVAKEITNGEVIGFISII